MIRYLLFFLLLTASSTLLAQSVPPPIAPQPTAPDSIPTTFGKWYVSRYEPSATVADTTGALVSLFARKRSNALWRLVLSTVGFVFLSPGESSTTGPLPPDDWQYAVGIPLIVGGAASYAVRLGTYSRDVLRQIELDYEAGKPIPAKWRRKLKPVYFASAAIMRVTLLQELQLAKLKEQKKAARKNRKI